MEIVLHGMLDKKLIKSFSYSSENGDPYWNVNTLVSFVNSTLYHDNIQKRMAAETRTLETLIHVGYRSEKVKSDKGGYADYFYPPGRGEWGLHYHPDTGLKGNGSYALVEVHLIELEDLPMIMALMESKDLTGIRQATPHTYHLIQGLLDHRIEKMIHAATQARLEWNT